MFSWRFMVGILNDSLNNSNWKCSFWVALFRPLLLGYFCRSMSVLLSCTDCFDFNEVAIQEEEEEEEDNSDWLSLLEPRGSNNDKSP